MNELERMQALIAQHADLTPDGPPSLRCGSAILAYLRATSGLPPTRMYAEFNSLFGIPVYLDRSMPDGRWEYREGDRIIRDGQIGPDDGQLVYDPYDNRFIHIDMTVLDPYDQRSEADL